jgi:hypothetical protein
MASDPGSPPRPRRYWFQFSIAALFGVTVFVALACTALLNASEWWGSATCTLTLVVLLVAVLLSVFRRGPSRAFWVGFAIFGWAYVLLIFWPAPDPLSTCQRHLLTTKLSNWAYFKLLPLVRTPPAEPIPVPPVSRSSSGGPTFVIRDEWRVVGTPTTPVAPRMHYPDYASFVTIAEWLWTLVLAMLGGLMARYLYATREKQK